MQVVRVENRGSTPHTLRWAGETYVIPPGATRAVPDTAVKRALGDWTKRDSEYDEARQRERDALNGKYSTRHEPWYSQDPKTTVAVLDEKARPYTEDVVNEQAKYRHPNLPSLVVYDFETGDRIYTVIDDPDGTLATGKTQAELEHSSGQALLEQIQAEQRRLEGLMAQLHVQNPNQAAKLGGEGGGDSDGGLSAAETPDAQSVMNDVLSGDEPTGDLDGDEAEVAAGGIPPADMIDQIEKIGKVETAADTPPDMSPDENDDQEWEYEYVDGEEGGDQ